MAGKGGSNVPEFKIVVMGGGGVGKSALTIRLVSGNWLDDYDPTIEDSYRTQASIDGRPAMLDILDTAGQDEFAAMRDLWIRDAAGFLLVYSITWSNTLEQVSKIFEQIEKIKEDDLSTIAVVLAGNKCDLTDSRQVEVEEGQSLVDEWKQKGVSAAFFETSAKAEINNKDCYFEIVRLLRPKMTSNVNVVVDDGGSGCCSLL